MKKILPHILHLLKLFWQRVATLMAAPPKAKEGYARTAPTDQLTIDIFAGQWTSKFPPPFDRLKAGEMALFQDVRLDWALQKLGGVMDQSVLELGPLEGGHSYMLEKAGASAVVAVEASSTAYFKCLIAREILDLARTRFLYGDFVEYLGQCNQRFGLIVASGVLYHMKDPLRLLSLIASHTDRVYMWTHYYDKRVIAANPRLQKSFKRSETVIVGNESVVLHRHDYRDMLLEKTFCGGSETYSTWLTRDSLFSVLKSFGFTDFETSFEMPEHPHGPALSFVAVRNKIV